MTYNDLRKGRVSDVGRAYHLVAATRDRRPVFADWWAGRCVVRHLARLEAEGQAETLCFVVMPDHVHWLMVLRGGTLGNLMKRLKGRVAQELGHALWQPGYFDHGVRAEEDLLVLARYIVANPLRAGLVECLGDYALWDAAWVGK